MRHPSTGWESNRMGSRHLTCSPRHGKTWLNFIGRLDRDARESPAAIPRWLPATCGGQGTWDGWRGVSGWEFEVPKVTPCSRENRATWCRVLLVRIHLLAMMERRRCLAVTVNGAVRRSTSFSWQGIQSIYPPIVAGAGVWGDLGVASMGSRKGGKLPSIMLWIERTPGCLGCVTT